MRRREFLGLACLFVAAEPGMALATDLRILSGSGVQPVMNQIIPDFERISGHRVSIVYGTVGEMAGRVQEAELADIVIASGPQIENLEKLGKVVSGTRTDLAKTGVGLF